MNKVVLLGSAMMLIGLFTWNILLKNEISDLKQENRILQSKFDARLGEVDILSYDLVTTRDSLRILIESMDSVPKIEQNFQFNF